MATTITASIALALSLLPLLYWRWRNFLRKHAFHVPHGEVVTELETRRDEAAAVITGAAFTLSARGGGHPCIVVDAALWLSRSRPGRCGSWIATSGGRGSARGLSSTTDAGSR